MKHLTSFTDFEIGNVNEGVKVNPKANQGKKFVIKSELSYGKIEQAFYLFVGDNSVTFYDMFGPSMRGEVEKWEGAPREDAVKHLESVKGDESEDAFRVISVNVVGSDIIYAWFHGTRIGTVANKEGEHILWENLTDACLSLALHIISKTYLATKGIDWTSDKGLKQWPDFTQNDKKGLVPFNDLQALTDQLVAQLQPVYKQYMAKYAQAQGQAPVEVVTK
jgi:hypothetical protein